MAIGVGSLVSPKLVIEGAANVKGPVFGISESAGTPFTVTWNDGSRVASIPNGSLDEITAADAAVLNEFVGRRAQINTPTGANSWSFSVCVGAYKRGLLTYLLLQNPTGEYFVEVQSAACTAL